MTNSKDNQRPASLTPQERSKIIVRTSIKGIITNMLLVVFKMIIGILSNSISIILDAVNNLTDAASSVVTIVGTKLAGRQPDKKHPFGYGRIEYLTAMIISVIVLYAGISSLVESIKKIIDPETPDYSVVSLIIIAAGVAVKFILGRYVKSVGKRVNSDSLINSGEDARLDAIISASTLAAAILYLIFGIKLEAWLGAIISAVIIKAGIDMLRGTLSQILGERADASVARELKKEINSFPGVTGVYDLVLNNYGPDTYNGSVHIGVADTMTANELDELTRTVTATVYQKYNILLTAIGIYPVNTKDENVISIRDRIAQIVTSDPNIKEFHGFYLYEEKKIIRFDLVISFNSPDREKTFAEAVARVKESFPDYEITAAFDTDFSEED